MKSDAIVKTFAFGSLFFTVFLTIAELIGGEIVRVEQLMLSIFIFFIALVFSGIASIPIFFIISEKRITSMTKAETWTYVRKELLLLFLIYFVLFSIVIHFNSPEFDVNSYIALAIVLGTYLLTGFVVWKREIKSVKQREFD
ncbi:MAG: hypothetical protein RL632_378 [Bacteroidota bacterium]|jgi:hypothetical protein